MQPGRFEHFQRLEEVDALELIKPIGLLVARKRLPVHAEEVQAAVGRHEHAPGALQAAEDGQRELVVGEDIQGRGRCELLQEGEVLAKAQAGGGGVIGGLRAAHQDAGAGG